MRRYVIIGSGVAGISAVEAIRKHDTQGEVTVISNDPGGYYSRPGLAYLLTREIPENYLFPFTKKDFHSLNVRWLHATVSRIDCQRHAILISPHGKTGQYRIDYDRLLIATGASAAPLDIPGKDLEGVVKLDSLEDARKIIKLASKTKIAVVVGGGITALELVEGLISNRVKVHYFLRGDKYWNNVLDDTESTIIEDRLKEEGVLLHYRTELLEILDRKGKVEGVRTKDGKTIRCEMVAYAVGIRPRIELAHSANLKIDRGILVDEHLATSETDIYCAGDVAQVYDPLTKKSVLDSLWNPAREQGYTSGENMAGQNKNYRKEVPFNVTRLAGLTTTIIGVVGQGRDMDIMGIARGDSETWRQLPDAISAQADFDVNRLRVIVGDKHLIGAIVMGDQTLSQPLQVIISNAIDISPIREGLLRPNAALADILVDFYTQIHSRKN